MRMLFMGLGVALILGVAPWSLRAQEAAGSETVPAAHTEGGETSPPAAAGYQGPRETSIDRQRQIETARPSIEQRKRAAETRLRDAERHVRERRSEIYSRLSREKRNIVRRNESAADREMRLRNLENELRRVEAERWQADNMERSLRNEYTSMGRTAGAPSRLR